MNKIVEHPLYRLIAICFLVLVLVYSCTGNAQTIADELAENGNIERQGNCVYNGQERYCILLRYEDAIYIAVGNRTGNTFYVRHIFVEVNGALVPVWNHDDVEV